MSLSLELSDELVDALVERVTERIEARKRWATTEGVAEYLGVSTRFVRGLRERGMPAGRVGKRLIYSLDEVDAFLEKQ